MKTIPLLIQALQHSKSPKETFQLYKGMDWKEHVSYIHGAKHCYPTVLWKNHTMELLVMGWCTNQTYRTFTNYNVIYSHILEGSLFSNEITNEIHKKTCFLQTNSWHTIMPFSIVDMKSPMQSASLHLFHYSYFK
jgi:hypothetical protein